MATDGLLGKVFSEHPFYQGFLVVHPFASDLFYTVDFFVSFTHSFRFRWKPMPKALNPIAVPLIVYDTFPRMQGLCLGGCCMYVFTMSVRCNDASLVYICFQDIVLASANHFFLFDFGCHLTVRTWPVYHKA